MSAGRWAAASVAALGRLKAAAFEPEFKPSIGLVEDTQEGVRGPIWVRGGIPIESGLLYR